MMIHETEMTKYEQDQLLTEIETVVRRGDPYSARRMAFEAGVNRPLGDLGVTILTLAAQFAVPAVIKELIEIGANTELGDYLGSTPLMHAVQARNLENVKCLIREGAKVNAKDNDGETALMRAAQEGSAEIVKYLVCKGAHVNTKSRHDGTTALKYAALAGHFRIVFYLLKRGAFTGSKDFAGLSVSDRLAQIWRDPLALGPILYRLDGAQAS